MMKKIILYLFMLSTLVASPVKIAFQDRVIDALFIIAWNEKLFEKSGVEVELMRFTNGPATSEALIFGDATMATMGDSAALIALSKFCPKIKILSALGGGESRHSVVVRSDSNINELKDLKGKKIAIKKGTSTHGGFLLKAQASNLHFQNELIDLKPSLMAQALLSKEVDAIVASEPTPSQLVEKGFAKRVLSLDGVGSNYPLLLLVKDESITRKKMKEILLVLQNALDFLNHNPQKSYEIISRVTNLSLEATKEAMSRHQYSVSLEELSLKSLEMMAKFLYEAKKIKNIPDLDSCVKK